MVRDDLQRRVLLQRTAEGEPRHRQRGLVRPAEVRVDQVLRRLLALIVGRRVGAPRVEQDRQVVGRHLLVQRKDLRRVDRPAVVVGEDLDAAEAQLLDRAVGLHQRRVDVVHRQRRARAAEAIRMLRDELRHLVVRDARALRRVLRIEDALEVGTGDRQQLDDVGILVHRSEPHVQIREAGVRVKVLAVLRREPLARPLVPLLEIARRQDMAEDVDHHAPHLSPRPWFPVPGPLGCGRRDRFRTRPLAHACRRPPRSWSGRFSAPRCSCRRRS